MREQKNQIEDILEAMYEKHRQLREASSVMARCFILRDLADLKAEYQLVASNLTVN